MTQERWEQIVRGIFLRKKMTSFSLDDGTNQIYLEMKSKEFPGYVLWYNAAKYGELEKGNPYTKGLNLNDPDIFLRGPDGKYLYREDLLPCRVGGEIL